MPLAAFTMRSLSLTPNAARAADGDVDGAVAMNRHNRTNQAYPVPVHHLAPQLSEDSFDSFLLWQPHCHRRHHHTMHNWV
jgi:hypothetical protein